MWKRCLVYVDDIIVWAKNIEEHKQALSEVFERLQKAGLKLKLSKCEFFMEEVEYLGFIVGRGVVGLSPARVKSIMEMAPPRSIKSLQRFLGAVNWVGRWIDKKAEIAAPLTDLLAKDAPPMAIHVVGTDQNIAFETLKKAISTFLVLRLPNFWKKFYVFTDASNVAVGAMLAQMWEDYAHPISFYSKALDAAKRKWHPFEQESYAVLTALRAFRHYIAACKVIIVTDCRALACFNSTREVSAKVVRWLMELSQHGATFIHYPGYRNVIPDMQSRDPRFTGEWNEEELLEYMASTLHNAPLVLELGGRVEKAPSTFVAKEFAPREEYSPTAIINVIQSRNTAVAVSKIKKEQEDNKFCQEVVQFFTKGKCPEDQKGKEVFLAKIDGYTVRNGMVFKIPGKGECHPPLPYVCDTNTRKYILRTFHDQPDAGHPGELRMRLRILKNFWWPTLVKDVMDYADNCQGCHRVKPARTVVTPIEPIKHELIWMFVSLDHVGKFPKTKRGYTHLLVIIDRFSRWVEIIRIKGSKKDGGLSAGTTLRKFKKRIVDRHGLPGNVLTDGSTSFLGKFDEYMTANNVAHHRGKAYKHNTNGMAERVICTIEEKLRHYVTAGGRNWDEYSQSIQTSLNSHMAWGPKVSPFFLNRGRERRTEIEGQLLGTATTSLMDIELPEAEQDQIEYSQLRDAEQAENEEIALLENRNVQEEMRKRQGNVSKWLPTKGSIVMVRRAPETVASKLDPK